MTCIFCSPLLTGYFSELFECRSDPAGWLELRKRNHFTAKNGGMNLTHGSPLYGHEGKTGLITRWMQYRFSLVFLGFPVEPSVKPKKKPHLRPSKKHPTRSKDSWRCQAECWAKSCAGVRLPLTRGLHIFFGAYPNMTLGVAAAGVDWPPLQFLLVISVIPQFQPLNPQASW